MSARAGSDGAPSADPLEHASPDADLAEAQLALGRPELSEVPDGDELDAFERESEGDSDTGELARSAGLGGDGGGRGGGRRGGGDLEPHGASVPAPRPRLASRAVEFLRGSWRELQRVQWPDRRQVMQATGVVIGFVIVAGAFLGLASFVAEKLVNLIIK